MNSNVSNAVMEANAAALAGGVGSTTPITIPVAKPGQSSEFFDGQQQNVSQAPVQQPTPAQRAVNGVAGILNAFKNEFSTSVNNVYVNSLQREVPFREISVVEQKTLSKIMIENENRRDIVYDAQCALIQDLCLDNTFDVYNVTEFDRIHILIEIYQKNYMKREVTWTCKNCGTQNTYQLDFSKVSERLDAFDISPVTYDVEDDVRLYKFTFQYPNVRRVSSFYKNYMRKYGKNLTDKQRNTLDSFGNLEYINLFVSRLELYRKSDNTLIGAPAELSQFSFDDIEKLFAVLPQDIVFSSEHGILQYIQTNLMQKMDNAFNYEKCAQCGAESTEGVASVADFL